MSQASCPIISFGVPVRNGARFLRRLLRSIASQDYPYYEVVICDNQSSDDTAEIARRFHGVDSRFRFIENERDVGQIENFNRVFEHATGTYFRWIGADDWLDPSYARRCVERLEARPECVGCTTLWKYEDDDGVAEVVRYGGRRVDSPHALHRLLRMLWFLQKDLGVDPIYTVLRRSVLADTKLLPVSPWTDRALALELAIRGPFCHVHEVLAARRNAREPARVRLSRYHPSIDWRRATQRRLAPRWTMYRDLARVVWDSRLGPGDKIVGTNLVVGSGAVHHARALGARAHGALRDIQPDWHPSRLEILGRRL